MRLLKWTILLFMLVLTACSKPLPPNARHIKVVMKKYAIEPAEIHIRLGETVVLDVHSADVEHGFRSKDLKIDEPVRSYWPAHIVLTPDRKGTFLMDCSILCGKGHEDMMGKIIVE